MTINFLDLFSGIGGFRLAASLANLPIEAEYHSDIDAYANAVYAERWPASKQLGDISKINGKKLREANGERDWIICGGFPCQDVSTAGKRAGLHGARSGLWFEMLRLIEEIRPRYVLAENVRGLCRSGLRECLKGLADCGYDAEWKVVRACEQGLPHNRQRVWITAYPTQARCDTDSESHPAGRKVLDESDELDGSLDRLAVSIARATAEASGLPRSEPYVYRRNDGFRGELHSITGSLSGGFWMDGDRVAQEAIAQGRIECDFETGKVFSTRIRGRQGERVELMGANVNGYRNHNIYLDGKKHYIRAHRIIWIAANGPIPEGMMIDHINRIRTDNRLCNLRLVDAKGNSDNRGYSKGSRILTDPQREEILALYECGNETYASLGRRFNVSKATIRDVIKGRTMSEFDAMRKRVAALGNSIVPAIAADIFRQIQAAERLQAAPAPHSLSA